MLLSADSAADFSLWWVLVGLVGVTLLLVQLRRHQFRAASARDLTREQFARLRDQRDVQQSLDQLLVQLEELSRRINAQVDTKFMKLEAVIRDADQRIARLEGTLEQVNRMRAHLANLVTARDPRAGFPAAPDRGRKPAPAPPRPAEPRRPAPQPSQRPAVPGGTGPVRPADEAQRRQVYELADAGQRPVAIAERLGLMLGEVELILRLRDFG